MAKPDELKGADLRAESTASSGDWFLDFYAESPAFEAWFAALLPESIASCEAELADFSRKLAAGTVTNAALACYLAFADGPIPLQVRMAISGRLQAAPEPGRGRGRPRLSEIGRRCRDWALVSRQIAVERAWAEAGRKRGQLARAIEVVADELGLSPSTLKKERDRDLQRVLRRDSRLADFYTLMRTDARRGDARRYSDL